MDNVSLINRVLSVLDRYSAFLDFHIDNWISGNVVNDGVVIDVSISDRKEILRLSRDLLDEKILIGESLIEEREEMARQKDLLDEAEKIKAEYPQFGVETAKAMDSLFNTVYGQCDPKESNKSKTLNRHKIDCDYKPKKARKAKNGKAKNKRTRSRNKVNKSTKRSSV